MHFVELLIIALGFSMDAFAVSICKGLSTPKAKLRHMLIVGAWFGGFQALMPLVGYLVGTTFASYIEAFDHWVAFILLGFIGVNMIREAVSGEEEETNDCFGAKTMFVMAIATSIDALAGGVAFALIPDINIWLTVAAIGLVTFVTSAIGVKVGNLFGARFKSRAELAGGIILVLMGIKFLLEGLGLIAF